jgi:hypothetical protein
MVGVSLLIGGVGQCFLTLKAGAFGRGLLTFVVGALMVVTGMFKMTQPGRRARIDYDVTGGLPGCSGIG